jgi:DNA (cytosine-5)-methyltransferase 1
MRYLSVCSGIEAATVAWHDLGWQPAAFSEIEPFPSAVLKHHYPDVPNVGDMTKYKEWDIGTIDLLVGGTPCQSFSVAGLRKGLEDPRGNLALVYCGILDRFKPKWFVWENVPGVLSSSGGRDFGSFLGAVAELGYGFAYRVLDAQYFGVAQRRRRVFVVGCLGDWRSAAEVLFEPESLRRDPAPSREKGQEVAGTIAARFGISRNNHEECVAQTLQARVGQGGFDLENETPIIMSTLCASDATKWGSNQWVDEGKAVLHPIALAENTIGRQPQNGGNGNGFTVGGPMYTLNATGVHGVAQAIPLDLRNAGRDPEKYDAINRQNVGVGEAGDPAHTVTSAFVHGVAQPIGWSEELNALEGVQPTLQRGGQGGRHEGVMTTNMAVRRLTPTECERLQGFPDSYTNIPWRKQPESPDGPRYKALGNSMAVPVMAWIGRRIANVA